MRRANWGELIQKMTLMSRISTDRDIQQLESTDDLVCCTRSSGKSEVFEQLVRSKLADETDQDIYQLLTSECHWSGLGFGMCYC